MSNRRTEHDFEADDLLMSEDLDMLDDSLDDEEQEQRHARSRAFNMDMRHRIEERLEEQRLKKELDEYSSFDLEDETLH